MSGMGMSLYLVQSQALELRQTLECTLSQTLLVKQELKLTLALYQEREGICTKLYKDALKKGKVRQYQGHGMNFEFALVSKKDVPEYIYKQTGHAFSHCLMKGWDTLLGGGRYAMAKGSWLLFVIYDMYPETLPDKVIEYSAVHERGEMITLGDHNLASKLEFAITAKEGKLRWYMEWIERTCPGKFADVFSYQVHLNLPESDELQKLLKVFQASEEAEYVRTIMEEFEWPYSILQRLSRYKKANDKVIKIIAETLQTAASKASILYPTISKIIARVREAIESGLQEITEKNLKKYISIVRVSDVWKDGRRELDKKFNETLVRMRQIMTQDEYIRQLKELGITDSLSRDGKLAFNFSEVLPLL